MNTDISPDVLKYDESRFTGDGGDLTLLQWLRHAEQAIDNLSPASSLRGVSSIADQHPGHSPTSHPVHSQAIPPNSRPDGFPCTA
jgi:hypothetical protein